MSKIKDTRVSNNVDISKLNDFDLGVYQGYLAAKEGKSIADIQSSLDSNMEFNNGVKEGFKLYTKDTVMKSLDSFKQSVDSYRRSRTMDNFLKAIDSYYQVVDKDKRELSIVQGPDGKNTIGEVYEQNELEELKKKMEEDPSLEIIGEDKQSGTVLVRHNNEVSDSALHRLAKKFNCSYVLGKLFDSTGHVVGVGLESSKNFIINESQKAKTV